MRFTRRREQDTGDRRVAWQAASLLLAYPDENLVGQLDLVAAAVASITPSLRDPLLGCVRELRALAPLDAAAAYVSTFDWRRRRTLFLTYYTAGDTRNRGIALLEFADTYRRAGVEPPAHELPDHLAVVLEFAATVDETAGLSLLSRHRSAIELLHEGLRRATSPYAAVISTVAATLPTPSAADLGEARRIAAQGPPAESVGLDPYPTAGRAVDLGNTIRMREAAR